MSFSLPPGMPPISNTPVSASPYNGSLHGVVPAELAIAGGAALRLGRLRAKEINKVLVDNDVLQFQLLGRDMDGALVAYDPQHRETISSERAWTSSIDYSLSIQNSTGPNMGDTITIGEIVLTLIDGNNNNGLGIGAGSGNVYPPTLTTNLAAWFGANPGFHLTASIADFYQGIRVTSTLPGTQGNGREVTSTIVDFNASNEEGTDLVIGALDQEPKPVGVAAFPAEPGDLLTYFPRGRFRWTSLIWPDYLTSKGDRLEALRGTGIVGVSRFR